MASENLTTEKKGLNWLGKATVQKMYLCTATISDRISKSSHPNSVPTRSRAFISPVISSIVSKLLATPIRSRKHWKSGCFILEQTQPKHATISQYYYNTCLWCVTNHTHKQGTFTFSSHNYETINAHWWQNDYVYECVFVHCLVWVWLLCGWGYSCPLSVGIQWNPSIAATLGTTFWPLYKVGAFLVRPI